MNSELNVQTFLQSGKTLNQLKEQYAINSRRHSKFNNLVLLKYNQIESPFSEKIVKECRGLILDESKKWEVVGRGFDKFFNYGEGHAANLDWNTALVQEKVDGSLCLLYHYENEWHVATTGTPDGSGEISDFGLSFKDYFWETAKNQQITLPSQEYTDYCFMLELAGPINKIVVQHKNSFLTVLGMRNRKSFGQEHSAYEAAKILNLQPVKFFGLKSIEEILQSFLFISPLSQEGYVVVDVNFNRVKIKHPGYIALHHAKDGLTQKAFVEIVRSGETSEILIAFPEFDSKIKEIELRYNELVSNLSLKYEQISNISSQKEFASEALKTKCSGALFSLRSKKVSNIKEYFQKIHIDSLMFLLGY